MTGGLLQMVISGQQDIYLTINPQITFFKKIYRRHTNFATELIEILPEQPPNFDNTISFILNRGDAIHRCYFEITLPTYLFSDQYITDSNYYNKKNLDILNLKNRLQLFKEQYLNLKNFVDIEIQLYRILFNYLETDNITINNLKEQVIRFNYKNKLSKDLYKNKIDESIYIEIDISGYISTINKLVTQTVDYDTTKFISKTQIKSDLESMYHHMIIHLDTYNDYINSINSELIDKQQPNQINFNFAKYLGHNFFENVSLEISGQQFDFYTKDILHINQMHNIHPDLMDNYLEMIGHIPELITYNDLPKGGRKILVPLIFWFCKNAGASLPLGAMQYSPVVINAKITDVQKIICFENYDKMFDDITNITITNISEKFVLNTNLLFSNKTYNVVNNLIIYKCALINEELLKIKFPDISNDEIKIIFENNGEELTLNKITKILQPNLSDNEILQLNGTNGNTITQWVINKNQWIKFLTDIKNSIYSSFIYKIMSYYPYINYNLYTSMVSVPEIKLICESVFMDDVERSKFAGSQLEYIIERYVSDEFTIKNKTFFDCEISFTNPCKELLWYIKPQLYIDGFSDFNQNLSLEFNMSDNFINDIISKQQIILNQQNLLIDKVDSNYYSYLLSYKYLNNNLPEGIFYQSFCLFPEETQPSGTANFRVIKGKQYIVNFNTAWLNEYTELLQTIFKTPEKINNKSAITIKIIGKIYDLFVVSKSKANLVFK